MNAHRQPPLADQSVGDYELATPLGGGPVGRVFLAKHRLRDLTCAVKVFDSNRCGPRAIRRSIEVSAAAAAVPGTGAAQLYEAVENSSNPFLARELIAGESLDSLRRNADRLSWDVARDLFVRIVACLSAAHRAGLTHGNLKPTNVRVVGRPGGQLVRLLDWGLGPAGDEAGDSSTRTDLGVAVDYQSPEQLGGAAPGPATDLYAIGIMLFEALTGGRPFKGTPNMVAMQHMRSAPASPRAFVPDLPHGAEAVVLRLLHKDPHQRPDASELTRLFGTPAVDGTEELEAATEIFIRSPAPRTVHAPAVQMQPVAGPITAVAPRIQRQHVGETTVVEAQPGTSPGGPRPAETVILPAAPTTPEIGAPTLMLEANRGPMLLDTDPGLNLSKSLTEQTTVTKNSSATIFVKPSLPELRPQVQAPPRPAGWRAWLQNSWTFEKKLIALNVLLGLIVLIGFAVFLSTRS